MSLLAEFENWTISTENGTTVIVPPQDDPAPPPAQPETPPSISSSQPIIPLGDRKEITGDGQSKEKKGVKSLDRPLSDKRAREPTEVLPDRPSSSGGGLFRSLSKNKNAAVMDPGEGKKSPLAGGAGDLLRSMPSFKRKQHPPRPGKVRFMDDNQERPGTPDNPSKSAIEELSTSSGDFPRPSRRVLQTMAFTPGGGDQDSMKGSLLGRANKSKWAVVKRSLSNLNEDEATRAAAAVSEELTRRSAEKSRQEEGSGASTTATGAGSRPGGPVMGLIKKPNDSKGMKIARQSMIMCMDPMCNRCPPEMHLHMRKILQQPQVKATPEPTKTLNPFNLDMDFLYREEEEEEEEVEKEQEETMVVTFRCCGIKFSFRRRMHRARRFFSSIFSLPPIVNPHNHYIKAWSKIFICVSLLSFVIDPLFFFVLAVSQDYYCVYTDTDFMIGITVVRSMIDVVWFFNMLLQCRLAFNATFVHVRKGMRNSWGELVKLGELVFDEKAILVNYFSNSFHWDVLAVFPLPQIMVWCILPGSDNNKIADAPQVLARLSILLQFIPRVVRLYPIVSGSSGYSFVFETAWASFVLQLFTFFMGSHVIGSIWYLLSTNRLASCLVQECTAEASLGCVQSYLSCPNGASPSSPSYAWSSQSSANANCIQSSTTTFYNYGIYTNGIPLVAVSSWITHWLYALMWGFQQISTFAGNLVPTTQTGEIIFMLLITGLGLFLFAFLIGNMQTFLQSLSRRSMEYQLHRRDMEKWMMQRDIPRHLQKRVRQLERYVWTVNQGVNEEEMLSSLTEDLQRDVRRHLSLELIKKCHLFSVMPDQVQDAICERLSNRLFIDGTVVIKEGYPVSRMFFVLRGALESSTTNKGRTGFHESVLLGKGDFFGEELLVFFIEKYAGDKQGSLRRKSMKSLGREIATGVPLPDLLPKSERTVVCVGPVDGFSLDASDIDFVCTQFYRVMQSEKVQQALDRCSLNRRTRAAITIQLWWRSVTRRRLQLTFSQMVTAVRTRRIGLLVRQAFGGPASGGSGSGSMRTGKSPSGSSELKAQRGSSEHKKSRRGSSISPHDSSEHSGSKKGTPDPTLEVPAPVPVFFPRASTEKPVRTVAPPPEKSLARSSTDASSSGGGTLASSGGSGALAEKLKKYMKGKSWSNVGGAGGSGSSRDEEPEAAAAEEEKQAGSEGGGGSDIGGSASTTPGSTRAFSMTWD